MFQPTTALLALSPNLKLQSIYELLANLKVQIKNKSITNTKEGILTELESAKPTYQFIFPGLPGVVSIEEVLIRAKQLSPRTKIVLVVNESDVSKITGYLLLNVDAIIWIDNFVDCIEFALKQLVKGELFICGKSLYEIRTQIQKKNGESKFDLGLLEILTDRELEILHSLTQGKNYKQIAQLLYISESTVKTHINNIFTKLNVNDRTQAVLYALRHGIETLIKKPQIVNNLLGETVPK